MYKGWTLETIVCLFFFSEMETIVCCFKLKQIVVNLLDPLTAVKTMIYKSIKFKQTTARESQSHTRAPALICLWFLNTCFKLF